MLHTAFGSAPAVEPVAVPAAACARAVARMAAAVASPVSPYVDAELEQAAAKHALSALAAEHDSKALAAIAAHASGCCLVYHLALWTKPEALRAPQPDRQARRAVQAADALPGLKHPCMPVHD